MRLDELVSLGDVLKTSQYIKLLKNIRPDIESGINSTRVKNQIIQSWKKGHKSRKHYDNLLKKINLSLNDLID